MSRTRILPPSFFTRDVEEVARDLLGRYLVRELPEERLVVRVVETEAYLGARDRASHAWNGRRTERVASLYLPPGHAYVYFIYGMHFCMNVVAGTELVEGGNAAGGAVLFRAAEVVEGEQTMVENRGLRRPPRAGDLAGGPAKLCKALGIDRELDGVPLDGEALRLTVGQPARPEEIVAGPRIGVGYAGEAATWPLRFAIQGHPEVSRPRL